MSRLKNSIKRDVSEISRSALVTLQENIVSPSLDIIMSIIPTIERWGEQFLDFMEKHITLSLTHRDTWENDVRPKLKIWRDDVLSTYRDIVKVAQKEFDALQTAVAEVMSHKQKNSGKNFFHATQKKLQQYQKQIYRKAYSIFEQCRSDKSVMQSLAESLVDLQKQIVHDTREPLRSVCNATINMKKKVEEFGEKISHEAMDVFAYYIQPKLTFLEKAVIQIDKQILGLPQMVRVAMTTSPSSGLGRT